MPRRAAVPLSWQGGNPRCIPHKNHMTAITQPVPTAAEKKQPKRRRARHAFIRLDDAELAELGIRSRAAGLSVAAYFRQSALGDPGPRSKRATPTEASRLMGEHIVALNRVGGNINQGIRALNEIALKAPEATSRDPLAVQIAGLRPLFEKAIAELLQVLEANRAALS
jgi:hypothetical protein